MEKDRSWKIVQKGRMFNTVLYFERRQLLHAYGCGGKMTNETKTEHAVTKWSGLRYKGSR